MRKVLLHVFLTFLSFCAFSQDRFLLSVGEQSSAEPVEEIKSSFDNKDKAYGDTLWYEDFSGGFSTNGWTSIDSLQFGFDWIYTTAAPGGQYSVTTPALNSITAANGFASLPSDLYNTPSPGSFVNMNAYLTSSAITISPVRSLKLHWRQALRFCCTNSERLEVQISTDSVNWTSFDAKYATYTNNAVTHDAEIDITSVAANSPTVYIRFYQTASHYYWMIDDIYLTEGYNNAIVLENPEMVYQVPDDIYFSKIPKVLANSFGVRAQVKSVGAELSINVNLNSTVLKNGTAVFSTQSVVLDSLEKDSIATMATPVYANTDGVGQYEILSFVDSDSINELARIDTMKFEITDSIFAKDDGVADGFIGAGTFGNNNLSGRVGTKYYLNSNQLLTSVSFYISKSIANVGAGVKAQVWGYDATQQLLTDAIELPGKKYESSEYKIDSTDLDSWLIFSIKPSIMLDSGEYVLALEQVSTDSIGWAEMNLGRDRDAEKYNNYDDKFNSFIYWNDSTPSWGRVYAQPMMRMHFGQTSIGFREFTKKQDLFSVSPNPSEGQFILDLKSLPGQFQLSVVNVLGQEKYVNELNFYANQFYSLDLTHLESGIYFVVIETAEMRSVEKIVIR